MQTKATKIRRQNVLMRGQERYLQQRTTRIQGLMKSVRLRCRLRPLREHVPITRIRMAESGKGIGTTTSEQARLEDVRSSVRVVLTKQLGNNLWRAVRYRVLNGSLEVNEDLSAFGNSLCKTPVR